MGEPFHPLINKGIAGWLKAARSEHPSRLRQPTSLCSLAVIFKLSESYRGRQRVSGAALFIKNSAPLYSRFPQHLSAHVL